MDRKLAAILAADVVGYAKLMEKDERGTFERLKAGRKELFEPEIARHHGRIFKLMGDGLLAEFGSVVDAVECAVSLQRGLSERNALARAYYSAGRPADAIAQLQKAKYTDNLLLAASNVRLGKLDDAQAAMAQFVKEYPRYTLKDEAVWPTGKQPLSPSLS